MDIEKKKLVVITGASSGIGAATARLFAEKGYPLLLLARRLEKLKEMKLPNTICKKVDVCNVQEVEAAIKEAETKYGPTDLLLNNAGIMLVEESSVQKLSEWNTMIDVNVKGLLNCTQVVIPGMKARQTGTVINVSSVAGLKTFANHAVYCGTKYFVHGVTETMREELSASNVRFQNISPGLVDTELLDHITNKEIQDGYFNWKKTLQDGLTSFDIAETILFMYTRPQRCNIRLVAMAPTKQAP